MSPARKSPDLDSGEAIEHSPRRAWVEVATAGRIRLFLILPAGVLQPERCARFDQPWASSSARNRCLPSRTTCTAMLDLPLAASRSALAASDGFLVGRPAIAT